MSGSDTLERFDKSTRWFHWTFAVAFLTLAATGSALALREALALAPATVRGVVRAHLAAAVGLVAAPLLVLLSGQTRAVLRDVGEALRWSRDDWRWLALQPRAALGRAALPPAGKLNAGQKLNSIAMAAMAAGFAASGAVLWARPGALAAWLAHLALFAAWLPLLLGHLALALVVPGTRPALRGMLTGRVSRAWAAHHHARWVEEAERGARAPGGAPPHGG